MRFLATRHPKLYWIGSLIALALVGLLLLLGELIGD